jgi:hypothetical protein
MSEAKELRSKIMDAQDLKRYLVFWCPENCILNGWDSYADSFDTIQEAMQFSDQLKSQFGAPDWYQIVDISGSRQNRAVLSIDTNIDHWSKGE